VIGFRLIGGRVGSRVLQRLPDLRHSCCSLNMVVCLLGIAALGAAGLEPQCIHCFKCCNCPAPCAA